MFIYLYLFLGLFCAIWVGKVLESDFLTSDLGGLHQFISTRSSATLRSNP